MISFQIVFLKIGYDEYMKKHHCKNTVRWGNIGNVISILVVE